MAQVALSANALGPGGSGSNTYSVAHSTGQTQSAGAQQSTSQSQSNTYIPEYSQTPILNEIAQYSRSMAPQVYQWGMEQYGKNQGNIDAMMRNALSYASPQRIASEMGRAEAGVQQGAEAGRQNAIRDLQSYGIDPSSGRYAALDKANQVMAGAAAAAAGNQQREATTAQGAQMAGAAQGLSEQNYGLGYQASGAMNALLGTGMQLKYSPLGTTSSSSGQSSGYNTSSGSNVSDSTSTGENRSFGTPPTTIRNVGTGWTGQHGGEVPEEAATGYGADEATTGGFVSNELSPSRGSQVDDVQARLNAGEFVVPRDVSNWLGQEYFYKLMAKARKDRAMIGSNSNGDAGYGTSNVNG